MKTSSQQTEGHSALPWKALLPDSDGDTSIYNVNGPVRLIADMVTKADADFIVQACNSHHQLVADRAELVDMLKGAYMDFFQDAATMAGRQLAISEVLTRMEATPKHKQQ